MRQLLYKLGLVKNELSYKRMHAACARTLKDTQLELKRAMDNFNSAIIAIDVLNEELSKCLNAPNAPKLKSVKKVTVKENVKEGDIDSAQEPTKVKKTRKPLTKKVK